MKKVIEALLAILMLTCLVACGGSTNSTEETTTEVQKEEVEETPSVVGRWISQHDAGADYEIVKFNEDGSGSIVMSSLSTAIPTSYEFDGTNIVLNRGSADDQIEMAYSSDTDQIEYDGTIYTLLDKEEDKLIDIWASETDDNLYVTLAFDTDNTGHILTMPEETGVAFAYEVNGNDIVAHIGSVEDNTEMTYLEDSDQISYDGNVYSRLGD